MNGFPLVSAPSHPHFEAARFQLDAKTKPPRSLGRLEHLGARLCAIQHQEPPDLARVRALIFAADHGVTCCEAVSPYPREVSAQMLANFARGGAAASVLARQNGVELRVFDVGVDADISVDGHTSGREDAVPVFNCKVRRGTRPFTREAAMTPDEAAQCLQIGIEAGVQSARQGVGALALGEMGIGNTSSAAALLSLLENAPPHLTTGRGTGLDEAGHRAKIAIIERALVLHGDAQTPWAALCAVGGLEIAALVGACIGAASARVPVIVDGFIVTVAALLATRLIAEAQGESAAHALRQSLIFSHFSGEDGHPRALEALGAGRGETRPLLDFEMRLGEASGAIAVVPLLRAAASLFEMASFEGAGVSQRTG